MDNFPRFIFQHCKKKKNHDRSKSVTFWIWWHFYVQFQLSLLQFFLQSLAVTVKISCHQQLSQTQFKRSLIKTFFNNYLRKFICIGPVGFPWSFAFSLPGLWRLLNAKTLGRDTSLKCAILCFLKLHSSTLWALWYEFFLANLKKLLKFLCLKFWWR